MSRETAWFMTAPAKPPLLRATPPPASWAPICETCKATKASAIATIKMFKHSKMALNSDEPTLLKLLVTTLANISGTMEHTMATNMAVNTLPIKNVTQLTKYLRVGTHIASKMKSGPTAKPIVMAILVSNHGNRQHKLSTAVATQTISEANM